MKILSKLVLGFMSVASLAAVSAPASAQGTWAHRHPRQHEVLARDHYQMRRIAVERRQGEITQGEARALRHRDRAIAMQDHRDARANHGFITQREHRHLNQELNAEGRAINR
ncbi:MAG: hypothetical protein M3N34_04960 [Pseudomonadota bacterium]|nr:hypothetical protein [Pseudomonadota bacterium]